MYQAALDGWTQQAYEHEQAELARHDGAPNAGFHSTDN
jgi:hypothetical protein